MRIFIAIELPEHVKSKIFHEFENLQKKNLFKGRFVEKNNLHLTLKFLGDISEERTEEIKKILRGINFGSIFCEVGKTGFFDNERHIKVIWVDLISEEDKLLKLQKEIAGKFPDIHPDYKNFTSHITVARVDSVINKEKLVDDVKKIRLKNLDFEVKEFVLMKSELMKQKSIGPKYKVLEKFKLK